MGFVWFLLSLLAFATEVLAYGAPRIDRRIVGGKTVTIQEYPYQVSLIYLDSHFCGGSLIGAFYVLTAAHCTDGLDFQFILVRAGSTLLEQGGQVQQIQKIIPHELFNKDTLDYDLAILRLKKSFYLNESIKVISLPVQNFIISDGVLGTATGWGRLSEDGMIPMQLQKVDLPTVSYDHCKTIYSDTAAITERMFCAGFMEGGKDTCEGDSGGPFVVNGVLVGITSWGLACASPDQPGVYTQVSRFTQYIRNILDS